MIGPLRYGIAVRTAALLSVVVPAGMASAINVNLTGIDALNASSFNSAGLWSNGAAPSAGNDYFVGDGTRLRTPADGASYTFGGDSLTINNTTPYGDGFFYKGTGTTGVITVNDLILDGGLVSHANGTGDLFQLDGNLTVASPSRLYAKQGSISILSDISGPGNLVIEATDDNAVATARIVTFLGDNTGYSGNIEVLGKLTTGSTSTMSFDIGASGVNNAITGSGFGVFDGQFLFDLTGASSNPGDSWAITTVTNQSYGANFTVGGGFTKTGSFWSNGTYLFNTGSGVLSVAQAPKEWLADASGELFSAGANWTGATAPANGENALFGTVITGNRTVVLDVNRSLNRVTFNNADGDYFLAPQTNQVLTLTGEAAVDVQGGRHWLQTPIAGTNGLTKQGTGELILDAANTFTGDLAVSGGRLSVTHPAAIPAGRNVQLTAATSNLLFGGDNGFFVDNGALGGGYVGGTVGGVISGAGSVTVTLGAEATFTGANSYAGVTTVDGADTVLTLSGSGSLGQADGTAATRTIIGGNARVVFANKAVGDELLELAARQGADINAPHLSSSGASSWGGNIKGAAGGTNYNIESTSGTLTLSGTISAPDTGVRDFVFSGAGNTTISGRLIDFVTDANGVPTDADLNGVPDTNVNNNVNVVKRGTGTLTIGTASSDRNNYWRGTTTIEGGSLAVVAGSGDAGELVSSSITVRQGATLNTTSFGVYNLLPIPGVAQSLGGGGTVQSNTLGIFEGNTLNPGDGVGALTINGAVNMTYFDADETNAVNTGAFNFQLGSSPAAANDRINVNGTLTINTTNAPANQWKINVQPTSGMLSGTYTLIDATTLSLVNTSTSNFAAQIVDAAGNAVTSRYVPQVQLDTVTNDVKLSFTGSALSLAWNGTAGTNVWNTAASTNWLNGPSASNFLALDQVTFGAGGVKNVVVNSNVLPGSTTFSSASTYTFTGTGGLNGPGAVNVNSGTVRFHNSGNNYSGATTVASGATLEMVSASTGAMTVNGTLSLGKPTGVTLIDDFSAGLGSYVSTVILDNNGGGSNVAAWQNSGGVLAYNTTVRDGTGVEQSAYIRSGQTLSVGQELQVDLAHTGASQDIGLYVGGTAPVTGTRQDYVAVYGRGTGQVFSRGFDGGTELSLTGGAAAGYTSLFIARTGENTYETGYYTASGRTVVATRTPTTPNDADVVGFFTDVRGVGVLGNLDNFRIAELGGGAATLDVNGDFILGSTGSLQLDITSAGFDSLDISGSASLAGAITVNLEAGLTPADGAQFTILSADGGIATALGSLNFGSGLPDGFTASYNQAMTDLILTFSAGLDGDFNGDGIVDAADYTVWRDNNGSPEGDLLNGNGDGGDIGPSDYQLWVSNYGRTSAAVANASSPAAVPEPGSLLLLAAAFLGGVLGRRSL